MSSSPSTKSSLSDSQQRLMNSFTSQLLGIKETADGSIRKSGPNLLQQGATPYKGKIVAPLDPAYGSLQQLLQGFNPSAITNVANQYMSGTPSYNVDPQATASYMQQAVLTPALRNFDTNIAPRIRESFAGGALSSRSGTALSQELGNINSNYMGSLGQAQLANQQLSAQLAESAVNRQGIGAGMIQGAATSFGQAIQPFQQHAQDVASSKYQEFLRTSPENNPYLQMALAATGQNQLYGFQKPGIFDYLMGGAQAVGGLAKGAASLIAAGV